MSSGSVLHSPGPCDNEWCGRGRNPNTCVETFSRIGPEQGKPLEHFERVRMGGGQPAETRRATRRYKPPRIWAYRLQSAPAVQARLTKRHDSHRRNKKEGEHR